MKIALFVLLGLISFTASANAAGLQFFPITPCRLADTRMTSPIPGGMTLTPIAHGSCGIPVTAQAIVGNATTVNPVGAGFLTLYASDAAQPLVANSNFIAGEVINNVFTVKLSAGGAFKVFTTTTTDVVLDVVGYYAPSAPGGLYFHPLPSPVRLFDSRPLGMACVTPGAPLAGNSATAITATGVCGGATIPATAKAISGNATTVSPVGAGFLVMFPSGSPLPPTASGNYTAGQVLNSPFYAGLSGAGQMSVFTTHQTHLVIDVTGYYSADAVDVNGAGLLFNPITPLRLLDTRAGEPGCFTPGAPLVGGAESVQAAAGNCGLPVGAKALAGNATVVFPVGAGFLTFWPSSVARPTIATSNFTGGQVLNRFFSVGLGAGGGFGVFSTHQTHLVIDVSGYFSL